MAQVFKTSRSIVRPANENQRFVYVLDSENPEIKLAQELRDFLQTIGYSSIFPNFDRIRVGTVHPFAILLAQDVLGQSQNVNVFPSVTISDGNLSEDAQVIADDYRQEVFTQSEIAVLDGFRQAGEVFVSDEGWARIQNAVNTVGQIVGIVRRYHTQHSIDFNLWSENKEVTSFLFDMICHFVSQKRIDLHNEGLDMSGITGRRSGDINLDFGMLLYGANVTVSVAMNHEAVLFDIGANLIEEIDTQSLPTYFTLEAVND